MHIKLRPEARILQQVLAETVTTMVHSEEASKQAKLCSNILFSNISSVGDLFSLSEDDLLSICANLVKINITKVEFKEVDSVLSLLAVTTRGVIMSSKREVKRMVESRGIMVNKVLIRDPFQKPNFTLLHDRYLLVQKGKKNYYLMVVQ